MFKQLFLKITVIKEKDSFYSLLAIMSFNEANDY